MSDHGKSEHTIHAYGGDLLALLDYAPGDEVHHDVLSAVAARWLTDGTRTLAPRTTRRRMGTVRSYGKWAGMTGVLADYTPPAAPRPRPHPLPGGFTDLRAMLDLTEDPVLRAYVALCGYCGLRSSEARSVTIHDVDLLDLVVLVKGKGGKQREVPIPDVALPILLAAIDAASASRRSALVPISDRHARRLVSALGVDARLARPIASHDLRATCATEVNEACHDIRVVQEILGHADPATTAIYTDASMKSMREALNAATADPLGP